MITRSRIAAVDKAIPAEAALQVIDVSGQIVTPLVDLHTHTFHGISYWGVRPDPVASRTGVTTWVDAGSPGAMTLEGFREYVVKPAAVRIFTFLNISLLGLVSPNWELTNLDFCDVEIFRRMTDRNRDLVVGVKARIDAMTVGDERARAAAPGRQAAAECDLPLMVHIAYGPPEIDDVLALLQPGDILTHCFTGFTMKIVDDEGRLRESARRRATGRADGHRPRHRLVRFSTAEALLDQGFLPDVISSDIHQLSILGPMYDLPTCLSKFLRSGLSLRPDPSRRRAAGRVLGIEAEVGTFRPGAFGDVAAFRLHSGAFPFYDIDGAMREGRELDEHVHRDRQAARADRHRPSPPGVEHPIWPEWAQAFTDQQDTLRAVGHTPEAMAAAAERAAGER